MSLLNFRTMYNAVIITVLMSLSENSNICVSSGLVRLIILIIYCVFLPLCTPGYFWQDARYCEFYFAGCWVFLYSIKSWALFRDTVKITWKQIDPFRFSFYDLLGRSGTVLSRGLIIVHYKGRTCWRILPNVTYVISVSSLAGGTKSIPSPGWAADASLILLDGSDDSFLTCIIDLSSAKCSRNPSADLLSFLSMQHVLPR